MGTDATGLSRKKAPALSLVRVRSRVTMVVDDGGAASTPSLGTPVTVPFLWEDAPGRPKPHSATVVPDGGGHDEGDAKARLMPLKLPPRLQAPSTATDHPLSPKTVLQGPYSYTSRARRRPPPTALRRVSSFRRTPNFAGGFFSRRKTDKKGGREHDAAAPDASCCSPSPSSSSSSSASFFGDDRGHGSRRRPTDGRANPEEDEGAKESVTITRFRRNRSLPSMTTTSHIWASIRKSVKQIAPWS